MKKLLLLLPLLFSLLAPVRAAVRAADDARVVATIAGDRDLMNAIYSDDLRYAHSTGQVDGKAAFIAPLAEKRAFYVAIHYQQRDFVPLAPTIVLMGGRGLFTVGPEGQRQVIDLQFLAVWREEQGVWRMVAWQSNHPPARMPAAKNGLTSCRAAKRDTRSCRPFRRARRLPHTPAWARCDRVETRPGPTSTATRPRRLDPGTARRTRLP